MFGIDLTAFEVTIQNEIVQFLKLKEKLFALTGFSEPKIVEEANALMSVQRYLEDQMTAMINELKDLKEGKINLLQASGLMYYAYQVEKHIGDVNDLEKSAVKLGYAPTAVSSIPWTWLILGVAGLAAVLVLGRQKKRR